MRADNESLVTWPKGDVGAPVNKVCESCPYPDMVDGKREPKWCLLEMKEDELDHAYSGFFLDPSYRRRDGTVVRFLEMEVLESSCHSCPLAVECGLKWRYKRNLYAVQVYKPTVQYKWDAKCVSGCEWHVIHCIHNRGQALEKIRNLAAANEWTELEEGYGE